MSEQIAASASPSASAASAGRRDFFKWLGGLAAVLPFAGGATTSGSGRGIDLGAGDIGQMNYTLVLEALEVEFYTTALRRPHPSRLDCFLRFGLSSLRRFHGGHERRQPDPRPALHVAIAVKDRGREDRRLLYRHTLSAARRSPLRSARPSATRRTAASRPC